jgi:hypothetical protein
MGQSGNACAARRWLSSAEEYPVLEQLEDALMRGLGVGNATTPDADPLMFVGRNTSAGRRDFYFYTGSGYAWQNRVAAALKGFRITALKPVRRMIRNGKPILNFCIRVKMTCSVCRTAAYASNGTAWRSADAGTSAYHWVYFATAEARAACRSDSAKRI